MSRNNSATTKTNNKNARNTTQQYYVSGNAVKKLQTAPEKKNDYRQTVKKKKAQTATRVSRRTQIKAAPMNLKYIGVMVMALSISCLVLMSYVKQQSDITNHINNISRLESELYELKLDNDELYTKIMSDVNLEEIKRIAVSELGMKYAEEGQVITYSGEGSDYVRQYKDIPSE